MPANLACTKTNYATVTCVKLFSVMTQSMMGKRKGIWVSALILTAVAFSAYLYRGYFTPLLPGKVSALSYRDALHVPSGFIIGIYADEIPGARSMTLSPAGTLFVGSRNEGKVYAVIDEDGDFKAERVITVAQGLRMPNGVAFRKGDLYVAEVGRILRFTNIEQHLGNPPDPEVITTEYPEDGHHGWKFIAFGPDDKLYVPVGAPCNVCRPDKPIYASITRLNPDGSEQEIIAYGVRNTVGFDWHPETGELWFTDNGRDWLGENQPADELNRLDRTGMHFGFPYCHSKGIVDPDYGHGRDCNEFAPPVIELGPHVAPLGMRFYRGEQFPLKYRNGIFIAEHGSWNRKVPIGYRVMFVALEGREPISYEVFAEGWLEGGIASGRPVDIEMMPDGSLLVSDDKGGRIYRISYHQ